MHTLRICRTLALDSMARSASQGVYKEDFGQKWGGSWSTILWWERMSRVKVLLYDYIRVIAGYRITGI